MLPKFIVIGAQKCGTTSLHHYLDAHPEILMSRPKEIHFFSHYWQYGLEWYESHFHEHATILGESSTSYAMYPKYQDVPLRMQLILGSDVKLIYILRDPINRVISQYLHDFYAGWYNKPISKVLNNSELLGKYYYIEISSYYMQLKHFLNVFPKENIKILTLEELNRDPAKTMREVFRFLEVKENVSDDSFFMAHHTSRNKKKLTRLEQMLNNHFPGRNQLKRLTPSFLRQTFRYLLRVGTQPETDLGKELHQKLVKSLKPDADSLRVFTGLPFNDWSI